MEMSSCNFFRKDVVILKIAGLCSNSKQMQHPLRSHKRTLHPLEIMLAEDGPGSLQPIQTMPKFRLKKKRKKHAPQF